MRKSCFILLMIVVIFRCLYTLSDSREGKKVRVTGTLSVEPKEYDISLLVTLHDYRFFIPQNPEISFGSHISVEGIVKGDQLTAVRVISVHKPTSLLANVRTRILQNIRMTLPEPYSALLAGATIGAPNIPKGFAESLRKTGTSHIVVASGGNLAILAGFLETFYSKLMKRKLFLPIIAITLILYSALTGFGAPIVRALIMWLAIMGAQYTGRVVKPLSVLLLTVLLMVIYKPLWISDVSFYLSIGATGGIVLLGSKFKKLFHKVPFIKDVLSVSFAAQIGVLPVNIIAFHEISLLSPVWNALVLWTVPYITIIGMLGSAISLIIEPLGRVVFLMAYPFTWYFTAIIGLG